MLSRKCPKCGCKFELGRNMKQVLCDPCELTDFAEQEAGGQVHTHMNPVMLGKTEMVHRRREDEARKIGATFDTTKMNLRWEKDDSDKLMKLFTGGVSVVELSVIFKRTPRQIENRLNYLRKQKLLYA